MSSASTRAAVDSLAWIDVDKFVDAFGNCPPQYLQSIFTLLRPVGNLIENAVKYGGGGKRVTVRVAREERDISLRGPAVRIDVIDEAAWAEIVRAAG